MSYFLKISPHNSVIKGAKQVTELSPSQERESRIINSIVNITIIMMSVMMGAFSQVMVSATSAMASGITEAFAGKEEGAKAKDAVETKLPEVDEKMKQMVSDIRTEMYSKMQQNRQEIAPFLADPVFDAGPRIIEEYDFNLPKLNQEIDDQTLTQYAQMITSDNQRFQEMFKQLTEWLNTLPIANNQHSGDSSGSLAGAP
jgi:F0F1-type ATP synthase membrane subunit b/b'